MALIEKYCRDIFEGLCKFYALGDAKKIYTIAALRVVNKDIKDGEVALKYQTSNISEIFPKL